MQPDQPLRDGTASPDRTGDLQSHNLALNPISQGLSSGHLKNSSPAAHLCRSRGEPVPAAVIEIAADYEGIVTVELEITKAGVSVKPSEMLPANPPAPEGEEA